MPGDFQYTEKIDERSFFRLLTDHSIFGRPEDIDRLVQEIQKTDSKITRWDAVHFAPWALSVYLRYREPHPGALRVMCQSCRPGCRNYESRLSCIRLLLKDGRVNMSSKLRVGTVFEETVREALRRRPHFAELEELLRISGTRLD